RRDDRIRRRRRARCEEEEEERPDHHGRSSAFAMKRLNGWTERQSAVKRSRKLGARTSFWLIFATAMKSFRFRSSIIGCSGSNPFGGRFSFSPPGDQSAVSAFFDTVACHSFGSAALAARICRSGSDSGCQTPAPTKHSPGS